MRLQYVKWLSCLTAVIVIITAVGCQRSPTTGKVGSMTESQNDSSNTAVDSLNEGSSLAELSSQTDSSTPASSNASPNSTAPGSSQDSPSSSVTSNYIYSSKVADKMEKLDPESPPEEIWVFLTPEASVEGKTYDSSYFPEIGVTVVAQARQGGFPAYNIVTSERIDDPLEILLTLRVNQPGWENFQQIVMALDRRDDIATIEFGWIGVLA